MCTFSELLGVITEILVGYLYLKGIFAEKKHSKWSMWAFNAICGMVLVQLSLVPELAFHRLLFFLVYIFGMTKAFFTASISQAIFVSVSFVGVNVLNELLIMGIFSFFHIDVRAIMSYGNARAVCILVSHISLWICVLTLLALTKQKRSAITVPFLLTLSPGYIVGVVLGVSFCQQFLLGDTEMAMPVFISAAGLLYMNVLIVLYAERARIASEQIFLAKTAEHHYELQQQYYEQLRSDQEETRAMFHDINKALQAMRALASEANTEEANELLSQTQKFFDSLGMVVDVGNEVVNIILTEYMRLMEDAEIEFDFDVHLPCNIGVTAVDMYVILGNALDNAIEACEAISREQRWIHLKMGAFQSMLFLQIQNPYADDYFLRARGKYHGFGLQSIQRCVEKHDGDLTIKKENKIFNLSLRMNHCVNMKE